MRIAKNLGDKTGLNPLLGVSVLRELASAPEKVVDQVIAGELQPTKEDIKRAKLEARLAKESEAKAKADAMAAQQQLFNLQETSQAEINALTGQYDAKVQKLTEKYTENITELRHAMQELEELSDPKIEIREVTKEVLPQSVKNELEAFQSRINELNRRLEFEEENNKKQQKTTRFPGPTWYSNSKQWNWDKRAARKILPF